MGRPIVVVSVLILVISCGFSPQVSAKDEELGFALGFAAAAGNLEKCKALLDEGADVNAIWGGSTPLMAASQKGYTEIVKLLLKKGADPNFQDPMGGKTALILAVEAQNPKLELAKALLDGGAKPNLKDKKGNTAADLAAKADRKEITKLLQEYQKK